MLVLGPLADPRRHIAKPIGRRMRGGTLALISEPGPIRCRIAFAYHLAPFLAEADRLVRLESEVGLLRVEQIWDDTERHAPDLESIVSRAELLLGRPTMLAPCDGLVAAWLDRLTDRPRTQALWPPLADAYSAENGRSPAPSLRLGSHAPETGGYLDPRHLALQRPGLTPQRIPDRDDADHAPSGLASLDGFLVARGASLAPVVTAFEAEALAAGLPLIATSPMAPEMEGAVLPFTSLCPGADGQAQVASLASIAEAKAALFEADRWVDQLETLAPSPTKEPRRLHFRGRSKTRVRVLFLSPNGIGLGHLTRQLAVARRLPPQIEPVFLTMSQAVSVIEPFGFHAEYVPGHRSLGLGDGRWQASFADRLVDMVTYFDARAVIFDGNHPYQSLIDARRRLTERPFIWLRRGLWRKDAGRAIIDRSSHFDFVIEPLDLARRMDAGVTIDRDDARLVGPIVLLERTDLLSRAEARAALALPEDATAVLVQLGSGNNFDMNAVRDDVLAACAGRPDAHARIVIWPIAEANGAVTVPADGRIRTLKGFPLARFLPAFDFAVSAAGYNSFHELISAGLPAIWVPNENPMMDEQEARALFAEREGVGYGVRVQNRNRLTWALARMFEPEQRGLMRERARRLAFADGGREAASIISLQALALHARPDMARVPGYLPRF